MQCYTSLFQEIVTANKGEKSSKVTVYRKFLECGVKTWEQVIRALERSGYGDIAKQVKMQLIENYNEVM